MVEMIVPAAQFTQSDAALEPSTSENEPAGQAMQAVAPTTSEYFPGSQFEQAVAGSESASDFPERQFTQSDAVLEPSTENEPAGQAMQAVAPITSEYFPGSQFAQTVAGSESASDFPAGQLTQAAVAPVITVAETEPAVQAPENGVHSVDATVSA
jgi:hypothetical protein